ncbi:MAG TPA: hypothetical protein VGI22_15400 [Xanthobacteraceae bacterium]|jgi:hypothetical protein
MSGPVVSSGKCTLGKNMVVTREKRAAMSVAVGIVTAALVVVATTSASWAAFFGGRHNRGGFVERCSLDGVNPVYHPGIFDDPGVAASYGFYLGRDGNWRVRPDCMRGVTVPY